MSLARLFEQTALSEAIRASHWAFPAIETLHLVAFATLGGAILVSDVRLLANRGRTDIPYVVPMSLLVLASTGVLLIASAPSKYADNGAFIAKLGLLVAALAFHFGLRRPLLASGPKRTALISIALWFSIALAGRLIGLI